MKRRFKNILWTKISAIVNAEFKTLELGEWASVFNYLCRIISLLSWLFFLSCGDSSEVLTGFIQCCFARGLCEDVKNEGIMDREKIHCICNGLGKNPIFNKRT